MKIKHLMMSLAASTMAAVPALATPVSNPNLSLSISPERASSTTFHKSKLAGGTGVFILILAIVAIGGGIAAVASSQSTPSSP